MATPKRIYKGQLTVAGATLYTSPGGGGGTLVKGIRIVNTDAAARYARIGTGAGVGVVADADLLLPQWSIDASGMEIDDGLVVLEPGQTINGSGEVGAKLTVHIFGMEL